MKKFFPLLYSLLFISCSAQNKHLEVESENPIGIGILQISTDEPLNVYSSKDFDEVFDTITFDKIYFGDKSGSLEINSSVLKTKLKPHALFASSSSARSEKLIRQGLGSIGATLKFKVIESNTKYFKVILNENTKEVGYLNKEERVDFNSPNAHLLAEDQRENKYPKNYFVFESWENYLNRVEYISAKNYDLYDSPNGKIIKSSKTANSSENFKVLEIKNNWAKVRSRNGNINDELSWWLIWKNKNMLLIDITERTME